MTPGDIILIAVGLVLLAVSIALAAKAGRSLNKWLHTPPPSPIEEWKRD
jgi:hypothetical protein